MVLENTEHPFRVQIQAAVVECSKRHTIKEGDKVLRETEFFVVPEFKAPIAPALEKIGVHPFWLDRWTSTSSGCGAKAVQRQCIHSGPCADSQRNNWIKKSTLASSGTNRSRGGTRGNSQLQLRARGAYVVLGEYCNGRQLPDEFDQTREGPLYDQQ